MDWGTANPLVRLESQVASLCEALADAYEELNILYELAEAMASDPDPTEMASLVLRRAVEATNASSGAIFLSQEREVSVYVLDNGEVRILDLAIADGLTGWDQDMVQKAIVSGEAQLNNDPVSGPPMLCAPLKGRDRVCGVVLLKGKKVGTVFTSGDLKLLSTVAGQMGLAIENARLHNTLKQRAGEVMSLWIRSRRLTLTTTEVHGTWIAPR